MRGRQKGVRRKIKLTEREAKIYYRANMIRRLAARTDLAAGAF